MKTPLVQLLMCHCHLQTAVAKCGSEVEGKMKTISSMTFIIDMPLSLTGCSGRDRQSVVVKWRER